MSECRDLGKTEKSLDTLIEMAITRGATHFTLHDISRDFEGEEGPDWHWDIYSGDPHKWYRIPKPWTISVHWLGNKNGQLDNCNRWLRNKWFVGFPWFFLIDHWMLTSYGHAKAMGCQMICTIEPDVTLADRLAYAVSHFHCDTLNNKPCKLYDDCDECPHCEIALTRR